MATFLAADARRGSSTLLMWVQFALEPAGGGATTTYKWSHVTIPDINAGLIQGRVTSWSTILRALSDRQGRYEGSRFGWQTADVDRQILSQMDSATHRYLQQRIATVHMITDDERRTGGAPLVVARGVLRDVKPTKRRLIDWQAEDYLSSEFSTSNDDEILPRRRVSKAFFPDCPDAVVGFAEPAYYGQVDEEGPDFHGLVPCIPVGTEVISSFTWNRFLVAGHACKEIRALFINGALWGGPGVDFLVPGYVGWPFPDLYRDITVGSETRRYTLIYARGPYADNAVAGTAPLTCNLYGHETLGTGLGTLITHILDQYRHWWLNYKIQNYLTGPPLGNLAFHPILDPTLRLSETAFLAAKVAQNALFPGGYPGVAAIGANNDLRPTSDWLQAWNLSAGVRSAFNRAGAFMVAVQAAGTPTAHYTQMSDIVADSFDAPLRWDLMRNVLPYHYRRRWATNAWDVENAKIRSDGSIDGYKIRKEDSAVSLWFLRNAAAAEHNLAQRLAFVHHPPRDVVFETGAYGYAQSEIGDTTEITHADGPGGLGWTQRKMFLERVSLSPSRATVVMEGIDLDGVGALSYQTEAGHKGTGSGGGINLAPGGTPAVTIAVATSGPRSLGGDRNRPFRASAPEPIPNYRVVEIDWSTIPNFNVRCDAELITTTGSNPVDAELVRVDANDAFLGVAAALAQQTSTTWVKVSAVLPRGTGVERYLLRAWCTNSGAIGVNAIGELKLIPI